MNKLVVGCGLRPKEHAINLDKCLLPGVDVVHDLENIPYPFDDLTFDYIEAEDVLEHVDQFVEIVNELGRILKVGGTLWVRGPHAGYPLQAWKDPTHKRLFVKESFDNFDPETKDGRWYGHYFGKVKFRVIEAVEVNMGMEYTLIKR